MTCRQFTQHTSPKLFQKLLCTQDLFPRLYHSEQCIVLSWLHLRVFVVCDEPPLKRIWSSVPPPRLKTSPRCSWSLTCFVMGRWCELLLRAKKKWGWMRGWWDSSLSLGIWGLIIPLFSWHNLCIPIMNPFSAVEGFPLFSMGSFSLRLFCEFRLCFWVSLDQSFEVPKDFSGLMRKMVSQYRNNGVLVCSLFILGYQPCKITSRYESFYLSKNWRPRINSWWIGHICMWERKVI